MPINERSILTAQLLALGQQVARAEQAVQNQQPDQFPQNRAAQPLLQTAQNLRGRVDGLRDAVGERNAPSPPDWQALRDLRPQVAALSGECLAFVQGVALRTGGVDDGLCALADTLLDEVASTTQQLAWLRYTVPAEREFVNDLAQVVRVRVPDVGIWSLPMAVHEFGHFYGPRIEERHPTTGAVDRPLDLMLRGERQAGGVEAWSHLHERFADLFAVYATGPAYACTCVLLRLDATRAAESEWTHPSPNARAYLTLKGLGPVLAGAPGLLGDYREIDRELGLHWDRIRTAAGQGPLAEDERDEADGWFNRLFPLLQQGSLARYNGWLAVQRLAGAIDPRNDSEAVAQPGEGLRDVLNAAWLVRLRYWDEPFAVREIGARAKQLCAAIRAARIPRPGGGQAAP